MILIKRLLPLALLASACGVSPDGSVPAGGNPGPGPAPETVFFSLDIKPIFDSECITCHGGAGGLDLESYAALMTGGVSGPVVIPGDGFNSLIIKRLDGRVPPQMPQNAPPLTQPEIDRISTWIDEGARDN